MALHDRKYMNEPPKPSMGGGMPKTFTAKYIVVCLCVYLIDILVEKQLTYNLCLNPTKFYEFEVWRLFTPFIMFSEIEQTVFRILGLVILYLIGIQFERMLGSRNFKNLFITICIGQVLVGVLVPENFNYGYFSGILSGLFVAYGLILGPKKMTLHLYFLIPLKLSGYMLIAFIVGVMVLLTLVNLYPWQIAVPVLGGCFAAYVFTSQYQRGQEIDIIGWFTRLIKPKKKNKAAPKRTIPTPPPMNSHQRNFSVVEDADEEEEVDDVDRYITEKVDPILEKIATSGMSSLTKKEKKILEDAKKTMGK